MRRNRNCLIISKSDTMKQTLFLLIFLFSISSAVASDFSLIIKKPFDSALFDITEDYSRTISAIGFTKNYQPKAHSSLPYTNAFDYLESASNTYGYKMHLVKIDAQADILLSKNITLKEFNTAVALQKTPTNGYFIGGYAMNGKLLLVKLDANAHLLYKKQFGTKNFNKMNSLTALRDGGVLSVGYSFTSRDINDNLFKGGLGNDDIFLTRFSKNGQILWSKKYGTEYDDKGIAAAEANDGSLVILSTTKYDTNRNVSFMRLDQNGDTLWIKHFNNTKPVEAKKIIKLKDGNFLAVLALYDDFGKAQIRLIKFDLHKNIIRDETIATRYSSVLNDIAEFSNGKLVGVGYVKDKFNTDGLAMTFDTNLKLLKQTHYGDKNYDTFNAVHILHNSQIAVAGIHTDNTSQEENMWIVKLNSDITMAKKVEKQSMKSSSIYQELIKLFHNEITNKELKINQDLSIILTAKSLYFQAGAYKLTNEQEAFLKKFSKKLISFLQRHKKEIVGLEINGHTSSEWQKSDFKQRYLKNAKLSLQRSYETLKFIFSQQNIQTQHYLTQILKGSGESYKNAIMRNKEEDKAKSRRVSFKILLR